MVCYGLSIPETFFLKGIPETDHHRTHKTDRQSSLSNTHTQTQRERESRHMASFIGHVREISFGMYWPENARVLAHFSHPHPRCRSHLGFTAQHVGHDVKMISAHRPQPTQISAPKASPRSFSPTHPSQKNSPE